MNLLIIETYPALKRLQKKLYNDYKKIDNCRLCKSKNLQELHKFKSVPIGNNLNSSKNESLKLKRFELKINNCNNCNHFQLSISINPNILYAKNYTYLTGITNSFKIHFEKYSDWILKRCNIKKNSIILDIGSNDGTCLEYFKKKGMRVIGIDPAKLASEKANKRGIKTINDFFNKRTSDEIKKKYGEIDFITSHNVLAHTENIEEIFNSIFDILKINGYFCFEIGYFKSVLHKNYFDTVYHEHLDYHHALPLVKFLNSLGFSIENLSTNNIQGGSLRILAKKRSKIKKNSTSINNFLKNEKIFFKKNDIKKQFIKFDNSMQKLFEMVKKIKYDKNLIYAYGSPTKASLLMISSKLNKGFIENTFEDNSLKCEKYIPGTDVKIISSKNIDLIKPKYILVLAWNFTKEIELKLKNNKNYNINLIIPLPKPKIIRL